ncbi:MAG: purine-nucleoside phosphorylase, partial [Anaerolineae bacterium]|nr:purine-nucleoside phosphorylase [Anaerolineae bacterium]
MNYTHDDYQKAVDIIRQKTTQQPTIGLVLGSGLGSLADTLANATAIPYSEIPGWPTSTVHGHAG